MLRDPLLVQIPQLLFLCYAIPTSLLLYKNSGLICFLLILLPATLHLTFLLPQHTASGVPNNASMSLLLRVLRETESTGDRQIARETDR
jgi:hypothetical protein